MPPGPTSAPEASALVLLPSCVCLDLSDLSD